MNIMHTAFYTKPGSTTGERSRRVTMSPEAPEEIRDLLARGPMFDGETERIARALEDVGIRLPQDGSVAQQCAVARAWYDVTDCETAKPAGGAAVVPRNGWSGAAIDGIGLTGLKNALIIVDRNGTDQAWETLRAAAQYVSERANVEEFADLLERIREMGRILQDEDGSNDQEHDAAYAVFEAAETFLTRPTP